LAVENRKIFTYSVFAAAAVVGYILWRFLASLVELFPPEYGVVFGFPTTNLLALVAVVLAVAAAQYTRRNEKANKFGVEVVGELKKVTLPSWKEIKGSTLIVVVMTVVVSLILFVFDKLFDWSLTLLW